jgi:hypothetical protein
MEVIYHEQSEIVEKLGQIESERRQVKDNVQQLFNPVLGDHAGRKLQGSRAGQAVKASSPIDFEDILPHFAA